VVVAFAVGQGGKASPPVRAEIPADHASEAGPHKLLLMSSDRPALDRLAALGVVQRQVDYGSFQLVVVDDRAIPALGEKELSGASLRDDLDLVAVNRWLIDTRFGEPKTLPPDRLDAPGIHDRQIYLVQFVGPANWTR